MHETMKPKAIHVCLVLATLLRCSVFAQDPAVFVAFRTGTSGAATTTITAPGTGWSYSAAAPVAGTTWNQVYRPSPQIPSGDGNGGALGSYIYSANNLALTGAAGSATNIHLTTRVVIGEIAVANTTRVEPNTGAGGITNLGPGGLMGQAWRIYLGGNSTTHTLTGLTPNSHFLLYVYGSTTGSNGCQFSLPAAFQGNAAAASVSTTGGNSGNNFILTGSTYSLTAAGITWNQLHAKSDATGSLVFTTSRNSANNQYFNGFQLMPYPAPEIVTQPPANANGIVATSASLSVSASNPGTITYQWQKSTDSGVTFNNIDAIANPTAATATLAFSNLQMSDAGTYRVLVSTPGGSVTSSQTVFTVSPNPSPVFSLHPASQTVIEGETVTFTALATAPSGVSYQWLKGNNPIDGATGSSHSIAVASLADSGSYTVTATNGFGTATSNAATLNVVNSLPIPAFPGAEGPGSTASGGRGGDIYHVTTLDDDIAAPIAGSLRYGLSNAPVGGRTIVFDVGGTIQLRSSTVGAAGSTIWLRAGANNITIAGQTAPYPGITIIGQGTKLTGDNMVVRNVAFRPGPDKKSPGVATNDGLSLQTKNSIIDHVSVGFADDEGLSPTDAATNTTVQYSIIAEGLNYVLSDGTAHAMGSLLASEVADAPLSLHHNLYSDMRTRNPRIGNDGNGVVLGGANEGSINNVSNNVVYNWGGRACYDVAGKPARANFINNYFIGGPDTGGTDPVFFGSGTNTRLYSTGNMVDMNKNTALDGRAFSFASSDPQFTGSIATMATPFAVGSGYLQTAAQACESVLDHAGTFWWNRSSIEARIINEVRMNGGSVIKCATEVASIPGYEYPATTGGTIYQEPNGGAQVAIFDGLPLFPQTNRPAGFDTDTDGMPDAWETARGLDPNSANPNGDFDNDGYTDLEEYLNDVAAFPAPKSLVFSGAGGRYEHWKNWDLFWQPSRYDDVRIETSTATLGSPGQVAGTLLVRGTVVTPELHVTGGWLEVANGLTVGGDGGTGKLTVTGGEIRGNVTIDSGGLLEGNTGNFTVTGNLTNHGTVRFTKGASLNVTGSFVNHGLLDIMTGSQTLPAGFVNLGTVLDSSAVRATSAARTGTTFTVTVQGYSGHAYQLQRSESLSGNWQTIGASQYGADAPLTFTDSSATPASGFYRISVSP